MRRREVVDKTVRVPRFPGTDRDRRRFRDMDPRGDRRPKGRKNRHFLRLRRENPPEGNRPGRGHSLRPDLVFEDVTITVQRRINMSELTYTRCGDYYIPDLKLSAASPETFENSFFVP